MYFFICLYAEEQLNVYFLKQKIVIVCIGTKLLLECLFDKVCNVSVDM